MKMSKKREKSILIFAAILGASGCASSSKGIQPTHVSSLSYQVYDCNQLMAELSHLNDRVAELEQKVDKTASEQKRIAFQAGAHPYTIPFLLAVPFMGNKAQEAEYSRLKGEYNAIQVAAEGKKCSDKPKIGSSA